MTRLAGSSKLLRAMNESATLALLMERGTLTRMELRELTGLSKPTTSDVLRTLTHQGLAVVAGHTSGGPGPNAEIYAVDPSAAHVAALSVREESTSAALCDLTGAILARTVFDYDDPAAAVAQICQSAGVTAVSHVHVGIPGSYDLDADVIRHIDVPGWQRPGLIGELSARLGVSVHAENDVNLAAIAERHRGVAVGLESFALMWFGTGLGCAIDLGNTLLRGVSGGAGELGYVPVGQTGKDLQDLVGGHAVLALAAEHGFGVASESGPSACDAVGLMAHDLARPVADAVSHVDGRATGFLRQLAERMAVALASVAAIVDPPLIVLAGEVCQAGGSVLRDLVVKAFHEATPLRTPIAVTALTDDAVLLGALDAGLRVVRTRLTESLRAGL